MGDCFSFFFLFLEGKGPVKMVSVEILKAGIMDGGNIVGRLKNLSRQEFRNCFPP